MITNFSIAYGTLCIERKTSLTKIIQLDYINTSLAKMVKTQLLQ